MKEMTDQQMKASPWLGLFGFLNVYTTLTSVSVSFFSATVE